MEGRPKKKQDGNEARVEGRREVGERKENWKRGGGINEKRQRIEVRKQEDVFPE